MAFSGCCLGIADVFFWVWCWLGCVLLNFPSIPIPASTPSAVMSCGGPGWPGSLSCGMGRPWVAIMYTGLVASVWPAVVLRVGVSRILGASQAGYDVGGLVRVGKTLEYVC